MYLLYINIILFVLKSNDWRKCQQYKCLFLIYFFRGTRTIILSFILYLFMASHHNTPQKQIQVCTKPMIVFCPLSFRGLQLPGLPEVVLRAVLPEAPPTDPHRREALPLPLLWQELQSEGQPEKTHAHSA